MKKILFSAVAFAVVAVSAVAVAPTTSEAVPSFARQTGAACNSCHFQSIPLLTTFGRNFSMSGMRDMGEQGLLEDDHLSLPASFNGSFLMKVLVRNTDGLIGGVPAGDNTGFMMPDESAIFIGGRYGEHVGGLTEISVNAGGAGVAQAKLNYVWDTDFGHVNLAMVAGDVGLGVLFSDPSNAVRHTNRSSIERATSLEMTDMMNSSVSGFGLSAFINDSFYIGGAAYVSASAGDITGEWGSLSNLNPYLRAAYIAEVGGLEAVLGAFYISSGPTIASGSATLPADIIAVAATSSAIQYGVDLQLQGDVGDVSVGFYLPYVINGEIVNVGGAPIAEQSGGQAMLRIGFGHMGINLGYDYTKIKPTGLGVGVEVTEKRPYIGGWYSVAQNVELIVAYTNTDNSAVTTGNVSQTTLVIEYVY